MDFKDYIREATSSKKVNELFGFGKKLDKNAAFIKGSEALKAYLKKKKERGITDKDATKILSKNGMSDEDIKLLLKLVSGSFPPGLFFSKYFMISKIKTGGAEGIATMTRPKNAFGILVGAEGEGDSKNAMSFWDEYFTFLKGELAKSSQWK